MQLRITQLETALKIWMLTSHLLTTVLPYLSRDGKKSPAPKPGHQQKWVVLRALQPVGMAQEEVGNSRRLSREGQRHERTHMWQRLFLGTLRKLLWLPWRMGGHQGDQAPVTLLCIRHLVPWKTVTCISPFSPQATWIKMSVGSCLLFFLSPPPMPLVNCSCGQGPAAKSPTMHCSTGSSQDLFLNRKFPVVQQTFLAAFITHIHLFWQILGLG